MKNIQAETSENRACRDIFHDIWTNDYSIKVLNMMQNQLGEWPRPIELLKTSCDSRTFRYFEGAGWDMPELANICEFGVTDAINRPQLEAELARIMAFSPYQR